MRKITDQMFALVEARLAKNGLAQTLITKKDARGLFVEAAKCCVGIEEATGDNDGFEVELIQKTVDGKAEGEPWCMAFMQTMLAYVERKLNVMSPLLATEHCLTLWMNTPASQKVKYNPLAGAIIIWNHAGTSNGHTGVVLDCDEKVFHAVEGNAAGSVTPNGAIKRDGNSVAYTLRSRNGTGNMKLLGFIKPF